jgi:hypothetical protein
MSSSAKIALIIVGVVALLVLTCVGGVVGFFVWAGTQDPPEGITVEVTLPDTIVVGDRFDMVVTVKNELPQQRTLETIDFYSPLLDGVTIMGVDPAPTHVDDILMLTYTFERPIPAEGEISVTFTMTADAYGYYQGDLDVAVDGMFSILTTSQGITIETP